MFKHFVDEWATALDQVLAPEASRRDRTPPPRARAPSLRGSPNYVTAEVGEVSPVNPNDGSSALGSPGAVQLSPDEQKFKQFMRAHRLDEVMPGSPSTRKVALRGAVPDTLRAQFWKHVTGALHLEIKNAGVYQSLLTHSTPAEEQIQADVSRTLTAHAFFEKSQGAGQTALYNVLKAYCVFDQALEYCQGTSFVVAHLLLRMSEEEAFWMLVQIIKSYQLRDLYTHGVPLLHKMLYVFDRLLQLHAPKLFSHFKSESVTPQLFTSQWFTGLFAVHFPPPLTARIWDMLFCDGLIYLYRVALAIVLQLQDQLLRLPFEELLACLKNTAKAWDPQELLAAAERIPLTTQDLRIYDVEYSSRAPAGSDGTWTGS